jgi:hypothetical protein
MFGCKRDVALSVFSQLYTLLHTNGFIVKDGYLYDQLWLAENIYPITLNSSQVYSSFFHYEKEDVNFTRSSWSLSEHIGKQCFVNDASTESLEVVDKFIKLYDGEMLSLKYFESLSKFYQKTRIILFFSVVFKRIKKFTSKL